MKYLISILCLFIFRCDSGGDDVQNTPIEEFQYPLAVGNEWNYMIETTWTPAESFYYETGTGVAAEFIDTTIIDTSFVTIRVNDKVSIQNENLGIVNTIDDVYEIYYIFNGNYTKNYLNPLHVELESKYYLKNTTDALVFIAAEDYNLMYNLPGFINSDNCDDVIEFYECSGLPYCESGLCVGGDEGSECMDDFNCNGNGSYQGICEDGPNAGEVCLNEYWCAFQTLEEITGITHFEPYIKLIEYPVELGDSWLSILNLDYEVITYCEDNAINEINFNGHPLGIGGYEVTDIDGNNCFEVTQYTNMDNLANDISINHKLTYCNNVGLYKNEYYGQLGEQTATDEFGSELGAFPSEITRTMTLIDYIIY